MENTGMYYRADDGEEIEPYCHDCAPQNYSPWEDVVDAKHEVCMACGSVLVTTQ